MGYGLGMFSRWGATMGIGARVAEVRADYPDGPEDTITWAGRTTRSYNL